MTHITRLAALALGAAVFSASAESDVFRCHDQPIEVRRAEDGMLDEVCTAAAAALRFLRSYDLRPKRTIRIDIVDQPLQQYGYHAYGRYNTRTDTIQVMTLRAVLNSTTPPTMYEESFDLAHYRGAIAHEVAHAVVQHNRHVSSLSNAAQEYLAHATQLAVLPDPRRAEIIRSADVGPWETDDVISDIYMAMAPQRFAVKSYLHLTKGENSRKFVQILLASKWYYVNVR